DLRPQFGAEPVQADRARVPTYGSQFDVPSADLFVGRGDFSPARIHGPSAIRRDQLFALLDQSRQSGLGIGADIEVDFGIVAELLDVGFVRQIDRGNGDR